MPAITSRNEIAAKAYLAPYESDCGIQASSEDALLSVINALYPDFPTNADGIYAIRADKRLTDLCDYLWEDLECEGLDENQIAEQLVPKLDEILG